MRTSVHFVEVIEKNDHLGEASVLRPVTDPHIGNIGNKCAMEGFPGGFLAALSPIRMVVDLQSFQRGPTTR